MLALRAVAVLALAVSAPALSTTLMTGPAGQGLPFSQYQPSLALTQLVATAGIFPSRDPSQPGDQAVNTIGMIRTFAGNYEAFEAPRARGQLQLIADNTALASLLQDHYGGDGTTTYALPNLAGRTAIGTGQGQGLADYMVGQMVGADSTILSIGQMPAHAHGLPGGGTTSTEGGLTDFENHQPSLAMTYMIAADGIYQGGPSSQIGAIGLFGGDFVPGGWHPADGRELLIDEYFALWSLIGTTYGGDGFTSFALPDLRGRAIVGTGPDPGVGNITLGQQFGGTQMFLTSGQLATHDHDLAGGGTTDPAGSGLPFLNHQPSLGLNYIVALEGVFPPQTSGDGAVPHDHPYLGEVIAFASDMIPDGWAPADGRLLPINQNQALFAIFGATYGGDGRVTFALPDLRGRSIVGTGAGFDLGMRFGSATVSLGEANLPTHTHSYQGAGNPVPEPASWAMMIAGFALSGLAIRRRRIRNTSAAPRVEA